MTDFIGRVRGKERQYVEVPKEKRHLFNNGTPVKVTKIIEVNEDEDSFRN